MRAAFLSLILVSACAGPANDGVQRDDTDDTPDTDRPSDTDPAADTDRPADTDAPPDTDAPGGPFGATVVSFDPGEFAGFGQDKLPDVVLGPPRGSGPGAGSLDVLSLGRSGEIVLAFDRLELVDGDGPDLLVFENAFPGWIETGEVSVSDDGLAWSTWPCAATDKDGGYPGCAGVHAVLSSPTNGVDPTDPTVAGGDAYDLADLGLTRARFVRIRDTGENLLGGLGYGGTSGGFDLDAIAAVHGAPITP